MRIGRARYVDAHHWRTMWPETRLLARVIATAPLQRRGGRFCLESAAVLHGLPLYRFTGTQAQLMLPDERSATSSSYVERRVAVMRPGEVTRVRGVPCTNLERTLFDLARIAPPARAFACANAAMRLRFPRERNDPLSPDAETWRQELIERARDAVGVRGVRRARSLFLALDGSAESVLEAVAHQRLRALGYDILTQVRVPAESGGNYYLDIELEGLDVFCEVDGRMKYSGSKEVHTDRADNGEDRGRSVSGGRGEYGESVLFQEKVREDWIRGYTGKRVIRLTARDLVSVEALRQRLTAFRVPAPGP